MTTILTRRWRMASLSLLALLSAWFIIRNAAIGLYAEERPTLALRFWPQDSGALAAASHDRIVASGGTVDARARMLARAALRAEPRSAPPLVLSGLAASADGDPLRAAALMRTAEALDPRDDVARYWLLDHDVRTGDYAAALDEVGPAMHLRAGTHDAILALVDGLLDVPGGYAAVRTKLASSPEWREDFFESQAASDPGRLLGLLKAIPPQSDPSVSAHEWQAVLNALLAVGAYPQAYEGWRAFSHLPQERLSGAIYDPLFVGLPGPPPFNWSLTRGADADARIGRRILSLSFSGGPATILAEQYALLAPGPYRFVLDARRTDDRNSHRLVARILCARDNAVLASIPLGTLPAWRRSSADLRVAPGCGAVRIQFIGLADRPSDMVHMQVAALRLTRI